MKLHRIIQTQLTAWQDVKPTHILAHQFDVARMADEDLKEYGGNVHIKYYGLQVMATYGVKQGSPKLALVK